MQLKSKILSSLIALMFAVSAKASFVLDITFDDFPNETYFGLWETSEYSDDLFAGIAYDVSASSPIGYGDGYVLQGDFAGEAPGPWQFVWDLAPGSYIFEMFDSYGDGLCCSYGNGGYMLSIDGETIAEGDVFEESEITMFTIQDSVDVVPASAPSVLALLAFCMIALRLGRHKS